MEQDDWRCTGSSWTAWRLSPLSPRLRSTSSTASPKTSERRTVTESTWQKSTYSEQGSACVEIARTPATIRIRDSKTPTGPRLTIHRTAWADFLSQLPG
ncbi:DUF397 domain-containing protein [Streptomyces sp. NPDC101455]|uniref:DUF397 domain-containing protein n=1 Tax=Streptomyces sp. NPDC101455 TaxID=3366142 RepID=UPI00381CBA4F